MQRVLKCTLADGCFKDVPEKTSQQMKSIRSTRNRSTEQRLRAFLIQARVRGWTVRPKDIPGTPEFVFRTAKVAVFTDGCFWHGCSCLGKSPKSNAPYWAKKIQLNVERDRRDDAALLTMGYRVIRLWEHEIRQAPGECVARIVNLLTTYAADPAGGNGVGGADVVGGVPRCAGESREALDGDDGVRGTS